MFINFELLTSVIHKFQIKISFSLMLLTIKFGNFKK